MIGQLANWLWLLWSAALVEVGCVAAANGCVDAAVIENISVLECDLCMRRWGMRKGEGRRWAEGVADQ